MKELDSLIRNKEMVISRLENWTEGRRLEKGEDEGWTANQIVEHMLYSEMGTLQYMQKKTSSGWQNLEEGGAEHKENSGQLQAALSSKKSWKAPTVLPDPKGNLSWEKLKLSWLNLNDSLSNMVQSVPEGMEGKLVSRHPYAGRQTMQQTMAFLSEHIVHHVHQLDRLEEFLKKG